MHILAFIHSDDDQSNHNAYADLHEVVFLMNVQKILKAMTVQHETTHNTDISFQSERSFFT